ncbi:TetR/AcrR family transcriptional regulator [Sporomusa termitida]|nr:TetR/AcrR family transcriptional regulator [Sporomusa termitida]
MMATIEEINENGIKFTMAELAKRLAVSKSTLYEHFASKEELIGTIVDSLLENVRDQAEKILDSDRNIEEKLKELLLTEPNLGGLISSRFVFDLKRYLPEVWKRCDEYREYSWQRVEALLDQGITTGYFRPIDLAIAKVIYNATINELLHENFLIQNNLTVLDTIRRAMDILYYGMVARETEKD